MLTEIERGLTVEQMRSKRTVSEALFKKFTEARGFFATHAFCFYEGEDGKYYNSRIEKYWGPNFIPFIAGSKKEVLKIMDKIQSDPLYTNVCVMFFVDRDYDPSLTGTNNDLFETPCYSVENLYAQETVFGRILQSEFGLNEMDPDYKKCVTDYRSRLKEFDQVIIRFNAIVKYQHLFAPEVKCKFSNIKTSHLADISISSVTKSPRYDEKIGALEALLKADGECLKGLECEICSEEFPHLVLRGKNQLDFFVAIVMELKRLNSAGGYFAEKHTRVHINITENRLSELSQYAATPPELNTFLFNHRPQAAPE